MRFYPHASAHRITYGAGGLSGWRQGNVNQLKIVANKQKFNNFYLLKTQLVLVNFPVITSRFSLGRFRCHNYTNTLLEAISSPTDHLNICSKN